VIDGENGMLVADEAEMVCSVERLESIDPERCRASVAERHDVSVTVAGCERVYRRAIAPVAASALLGTSRLRERPASESTAQCNLMVYSGTPPSAEDVDPQGEVARELERVLALLEGDQAGAVTIAALLERGVQEPAQAVYALQLAGYAIDRKPAQTGAGIERSDMASGRQRRLRILPAACGKWMAMWPDGIGAGTIKRLSELLTRGAV
jgi:hypothetical protein